MAELRKTGATQTYRSIAVNTVLGEDVLLLQRVMGQEALGRLSEFRLETLSSDIDIELEALLGTNVTLRYRLERGGERYFNGFVSECRYIGERGQYAAYELVLRPWLWFLTRTADCRIYQAKNIPTIVMELFREHGFTDYENALTNEYRQWEYCVQYRETDFAFVSRLLEAEGIYYFIKHENGRNILVLADSYSAHDAFPNYSEIPCSPSDRPIHQEHISHIDCRKQVLPGSVVLNDYYFIKPKADLTANAPFIRHHEKADFEMYDYPGLYSERADGEQYARRRIEALHANFEVVSGEGDAGGLAVGYLFTLAEHPRQTQNREYLVVSARHEMGSEAFETSQAGVEAGEPHYKTSFTAIDSRESYRPEATTTKPMIQGPQTATVVGPPGEEVWTDQYGRVKVQFHWDRYGMKDENSSCWIRVSQNWAGKGWGAIMLPRIGQEVIVSFLEGDPDKPIVTGRVYNAEAMPPYPLPDEKTKTTWKTNSSKGGGGFNEIRFEDKKDSEEIFIHGQKDQDIRIQNTTKEWVGQDRHLLVAHDQLEQVARHKHLIIKEDQYEQVDGDKHQKVGGDHNSKIEGSLSSKTGMDRQDKISMNYAVDAGMNVHVKGGMNVVIEAGMQLTIKAGSSFVTVGPLGVDISGPMVKINSGGSAGSGAGCSPDAPLAPQEPQTAVTSQAGDISTTQAAGRSTGPRSLDSIQVAGYQRQQAQTLANAAQAGTPFCEVCAGG